jgi:gas vesicle protein
MTHEREASAGNVLLAFIAGAAVGAAVALLFAPAKGEEMREAVNRRAREGRDRVFEAFDRARQQARGPEQDA